MTKKISEYFKVTPKSAETLEINKSNIKTVENSSKIRDCQVIVMDIKDQLPNNLKLFNEISLNNLQKTGTRKEQLKCKFCEKKMSTLSNLYTHMKLVHSDKLNLLSCSICNLKFHNQKFLVIHLKKKHPNGLIKQFECDFDGKLFKNKGQLHSHMKIHLPLIACEICKTALKPSSKGQHMTYFHSNERNFQCHICSKNFKSNHQLNNHKKTHNKNVKCETCKKMFPSYGQLNSHKRLYHDNADSFECEVCYKKFHQKVHYKNHLKTHDKNRLKPYKCQKCDFATDNKQSFSNHQKSHEYRDKKFAVMKNPIKCEICPAFHRNKNSLNQHTRSVHPKLLFQCDLCAKFVNLKGNLITHMKVHV